MPMPSSEVEILPLKGMSSGDKAILISSDLDLSGDEYTHALQMKIKADQAVRASLAYETYNWLANLRLFTMRTLRILEASNKFPILSLTALPMGAASLLYFMRLVIDISEMVVDVVKPRQGEEELKWYQRLANSFRRGDRAGNMLNDFLWLGINLTGFVFAVMTLGASLLIPKLCLAFGYVFDVSFDAADILNLFRRKKLVRKIDDEIHQINNMLATRESKLDELKQKIMIMSKKESKLHDPSYQKILHDLKQEYSTLKAAPETAAKRINSLNHMKQQIESSHKACMKRIARIALLTVLVAAGSALFVFCPPAAIAGLIGAVVACTAGSIFKGFGKQLYDKGKKWFSNLTAKTQKETEVVVSPAVTQALDTSYINKLMAAPVNNTPSTEKLSVTTSYIATSTVQPDLTPIITSPIDILSATDTSSIDNSPSSIPSRAVSLNESSPSSITSPEKKLTIEVASRTTTPNEESDESPSVLSGRRSTFFSSTDDGYSPFFNAELEEEATTEKLVTLPAMPALSSTVLQA